eukprot:112262-Prorocentrum_minimum.AAC.1
MPPEAESSGFPPPERATLTPGKRRTSVGGTKRPPPSAPPNNGRTPSPGVQLGSKRKGGGQSPQAAPLKKHRAGARIKIK